jgi:multiple sugar transport system substrate-binding protein
MRRLMAPFLIVMLLLLAACGGSSGSNSSSSNTGGVSQKGLTGGNAYINCPASTNTSAAPAQSGTVTLTVAGFSSSPAEDALVKSNLDKFHQLHPNININWELIPGDYPTKMRADVSSGVVPDVFYLTPDMSSEYISAGKLLNLSPYMARDGVSPDSYYSALVNPFTCTKGQIYGLPKDWDTLGVFYNKQMFQTAGLAYPTAGWTWQDMENDARALTKNPGTPTGVYGLSVSADLSRWGAFLLADGGSVLNSNGEQAVFNNQAGINSLNFYTGFVTTAHSGVMPTTVGASWNGDAFGKQRVAMCVEGGWLIPYLAQSYPGVQYGISPLPMAPNGKVADLNYTNAWAAYSGTKYPDAAWELIKYMTGSTVQLSQLNDGFALPTLKSLANAPYFSQNPGFKVLEDAAASSYADYYGPQDQAIHTYLANAIQEVLLGKSTVQAALNQAAQQVDNHLQGG